jgi:hypothetical protein
LLATSSSYVAAKFEFERVIGAARQSGLSDDEIARLAGFSRPMVEARSRSANCKRLIRGLGECATVPPPPAGRNVATKG